MSNILLRLSIYISCIHLVKLQTTFVPGLISPYYLDPIPVRSLSSGLVTPNSGSVQFELLPPNIDPLEDEEDSGRQPIPYSHIK